MPADRPEALPSLLGWLDGVATSGDPDLFAAGFLTYEAGVFLEGSHRLCRPPEKTPLAAFSLFRLSNGGAPPARADGGLLVLGEEPGERERWAASIGAIREGIARGDVYQVNLTRRLRALGEISPGTLAERLHRENPVPYAMTFEGDGYAVVSNSPELFLDVDLALRRGTSAPIKGTLQRAEDPARLVASAKDGAEHVMIVDLVRNDLGRVSVPGGVTVPRLRTLKTFRHLFHLESLVAGRLRSDVALSDVLLATLPAGSITGAPKRASLRFIRELEACPRGVYTGAVGYVRGNGRAVFNVAIRTAVVTPGAVDYHAGGGIVWDSDAGLEWDETETKSRELFAVIASGSR